jgi:sulfoxide reductase heme-binding subunit YedZ
MMQWFKKNWPWAVFNSIALLIFLSLASQIFKTANDFKVFFLFDGYFSTFGFDIGSPIFQQSGRWAIRFLLMSLAVSPIFYLTGWKQVIGLRKSAGLWAVAFVLIHFRLFFADITWQKIAYQDYFWIGLVAFGILCVLALTSHRWAMRFMKKWWKRLHRLVYAAGFLVVLHSILAIDNFQKLNDYETAQFETRLYLVILVILLVLRISWLRRLIRIPKQKAKVKREYVVTN